MIGADHIVPLFLGNEAFETGPKVRPERTRATTIEPIQLWIGHKEYAAQDQTQHAFRMGLRVDQGQRRAPTSAKGKPTSDIQGLTDLLHIRDEVPRRVRLDARMR